MSQTYIVVENAQEWAPYYPSDKVITFDQYVNQLSQAEANNAVLAQAKKQRVRIINLCDCSRYLSVGYYTSLIAEAREQRVIPSVKTLNDIQGFIDESYFTELLTPALQKSLTKQFPSAVVEHTAVQTVSFTSYFGYADNEALQTVARVLFERFAVPLLFVELECVQRRWRFKQLSLLAVNSLTDEQQTLFANALDNYSTKVWRTQAKAKQYRYDLAILVDPNEALPPSDQKALKHFVSAGKKLGLNCEFITQDDYARLPEYDALFIRTTTAIDHYTYKFAKKAEQEGLVVIDDPTSIRRCTNKIYLADLFTTHKISAPKTVIIKQSDLHSPSQLEQLEQNLGYPMVIKIPDGAFSVGVEKVTDRASLEQVLTRLFERSALLLAQEYLYTDFDWRVGVLNGKAIYASKYFMVKNHWQIYHHGNQRTRSGGFETLATFEVPQFVRDLAVKAANLIGNGLYGVDLKSKDNKAYVIEINDNPSIDSSVEDAYLKQELYTVIMQEFWQRLEARGK